MKKELHGSLIFISFILLSLTSCKNPNDLLLIGVDNNGKEIEVEVDKDKFLSAATQTFTSVHESTLSMLQSSENPSWDIDRVEVGVSVNLTVGVDALWKWSYNPGFRLIYKKNTIAKF